VLHSGFQKFWPTKSKSWNCCWHKTNPTVSRWLATFSLRTSHSGKGSPAGLQSQQS
jgi:hypothetical protein